MCSQQDLTLSLTQNFPLMFDVPIQEFYNVTARGPANYENTPGPAHSHNRTPVLHLFIRGEYFI